MDECKPLVMGFFTTVVYLRAGTLTAQLEAGALTGLAIPTLGAVGWAAEHGHRLLWFTDGDSIYGSGSDEGVMMAVACIECGLALVFIWSIKWLTRQQRETSAAIDVSNIDLTDYSLKVDGLPKVGRCRLPVSKPELKARLVAALETKL